MLKWTEINMQQNKTHYVNNFSFIIHEMVPDNRTERPVGYCRENHSNACDSVQLTFQNMLLELNWYKLRTKFEFVLNK